MSGRDEQRGFPGVASGDGDVEGRAGHVLLAPLDHQDVVAPLLQQVGDAVLQVACVFDLQLLTGHLRAADAHQEHVLTCRAEHCHFQLRLSRTKCVNLQRVAFLTGFAAVHGEADLLAHRRLAQAGSCTRHLAGVRAARPEGGAVREGASGGPERRVQREGGCLTATGRGHQARTWEGGGQPVTQ